MSQVLAGICYGMAVHEPSDLITIVDLTITEPSQ